ncbi:hypothetical protein [Gallibacter intestinalis]|uniref:Uncharacterized protein n=1 Tax=Gallibacter intestinalis TaxID=2779356 RepID=A0ABR9QXS9_9FIRM|nr:hypothetical protein [Gallibacter intestinalis]MBE5035691.1 hypothetical protein [Gallibacter intestinalis]
MMDAVKYLKIKNRMTKRCSRSRPSDCSQCVLDFDNNHYKITCEMFELQHPEEAVAAVEKWGEKHPETRMSDFLKKFPKAEVLKYGYDEYIDICPVYIDTTRNCPNGECKKCKLEYWNEEVEE